MTCRTVLSGVLGPILAVAVAAIVAAAPITTVRIDSVSSELTGYGGRLAIDTVDGSGFEPNGPNTHSTSASTMWLNTDDGCCGSRSYNSGPGSNDDNDPGIVFDLGGLYDVSSMNVWNYNEGGTSSGTGLRYTQRGVNEAEILVSQDNITYTSLGNVFLSEAPGADNVDFHQAVPLNTTARFVKIDILSNHGGDGEFVGLSEVRFDGTLVQAASTTEIPATVDYVSSELIENFDRDADYTLDESGLTPTTINGTLTHSTGPNGEMWLNTDNGCCGGVSNTGPNDNDSDPEIVFDVGSTQYIEALQVWNYNESGDYRWRGANDVEILISTDNVNFTSLGTTNFAVAPGVSGFDYSQFFVLNSNTRYVKLDIASNHGAPDSFIGLSEVKFFAGQPLVAVIPEPSTFLIWALGLIGLAWCASRRRR